MEQNETLRVDGFMTVMCILFPFLGILIYAIHVSHSPNAAKKAMIISLVTTLVVVVVASIITFLLLYDN